MKRLELTDLEKIRLVKDTTCTIRISKILKQKLEVDNISIQTLVDKALSKYFDISIKTGPPKPKKAKKK